jgi:hypothetical protein
VLRKLGSLHNLLQLFLRRVVPSRIKVIPA